MDTSLLGEFHETWIWFSHKSLYHISKGMNRVTQKWREMLRGSIATQCQTKKQEWLCYIQHRTSQENKGRVSPAHHQFQPDSCSVKQSSVQGLQILGLNPSHLWERGGKKFGGRAVVES